MHDRDHAEYPAQDSGTPFRFNRNDGHPARAPSGNLQGGDRVGLHLVFDSDAFASERGSDAQRGGYKGHTGSHSGRATPEDRSARPRDCRD